MNSSALSPPNHGFLVRRQPVALVDPEQARERGAVVRIRAIPPATPSRDSGLIDSEQQPKSGLRPSVPSHPFAQPVGPLGVEHVAMSMRIQNRSSTTNFDGDDKPMRKRMSGSGTYEAVAKGISGRALTPEQNDRVRAALREVLRNSGGNQTAIAPQLDVSQSALSGFLGGRQGTSYAVARRIAKLLGRDVEEVIEGTPRKRATAVDRYPNRQKAAAFAEGEIRQDAIDHVLRMDLKIDGDLPAVKWLEMMRHWAGLFEAGMKP